MLLRPVVPFTTGALSHIARATIPYATLSPSGKTGLGDSVLFDLIVFNQSSSTIHSRTSGPSARPR